jgi:REP-associated tyrosine transposase
MSHTFSLLLYHIVFSTQRRADFIDSQLRDELYPYMAGIVQNERGSLLAIGGMPDHVHLLVRLKPTTRVADFLRSVKANSSRWVHEQADPPRRFGWQEGYGAFTVSQSSAGKVCRYIHNQEEHHRERSFEEEWVDLLTRHGIEFDPSDPFGERRPGEPRP